MENIPENLELINKFPVLPELKKTESLFSHKDLPRLLAVSEINTLLKPEKKDSAINDLESLSQGLNDETMKIPDMDACLLIC